MCVVGTGPVSEKNVLLFSTRHSVSLYVPSQITQEDYMELVIRTKPIPIWRDPTSLSNVDLFVICVELNNVGVTREIDLTPMLEVSQLVRRFAHTGSTVIIESKVGVGVTRKFFTGVEVHCSYSPSQFNPDDSVDDITNKTTKLVGGMDEESEVLAMQFYETIYDTVIRTGSPEVAEAAVMLKSAQETVQEAFINEFSDFCDMVGLDVHKVIDATSVGHREDPRVKLPWIGRRHDVDSKLLMTIPGLAWPILSAASEQLITRPSTSYKKIVDIYCSGNYDKLHKLAFLVVGLGTVVGSSDTKDSPVLDIIRHLELEGAAVTKYDMFVSRYSTLPELTYNSGRCKFDGILVMHPYMVSMWDDPTLRKHTTFFCRH